MTCTIGVLGLAKQDIVNRIAYVRQQWGDAVADKAYLDLMDKLQLLATKVLYQLDEDDSTIYIHLIYSSTQNFQTLLYNRIIRYL